MLDDATATNFSTYLTPRRAQDFQNLRADWSSSALDRRQRFTFTPIYDWKPFKSRNWIDEEYRRQLEHFRHLHLSVAGISPQFKAASIRI